jgi:hypothetical protein
VLADTLVTLDGSGSSAASSHGPLPSYWQQIGGASVVLNSNTISRPTFTALPQPTIITFSLTVSDTFGLSSQPDWIQVQIVPTYHIYLPLVLKSL